MQLQLELKLESELELELELTLTLNAGTGSCIGAEVLSQRAKPQQKSPGPSALPK